MDCQSVFKSDKNKLTHSLPIEKRLYYEKKLKNVQSDTRAIWKVLNEILNRISKDAHHLKLMFVKLLILSKLPKFCSYFSSIGPKLTRGIQSSASHRSFLDGSFTQSIFFNPTTQEETAEICGNFSSRQSSWLDQIPMTVIKEYILLVCEPLTHIINLSIQHDIVPDERKIARVIPIFKSDDQSLLTNYRPISVFPSFSKFLERGI